MQCLRYIQQSEGADTRLKKKKSNVVVLYAMAGNKRQSGRNLGLQKKIEGDEEKETEDKQYFHLMTPTTNASKKWTFMKKSLAPGKKH